MALAAHHPSSRSHRTALLTSRSCLLLIYCLWLPSQRRCAFCLFSIKDSDEWRICFSVYQPDTVADFRKSSPGKPYARVCVCRSAMSPSVGLGFASLSTHNLTHLTPSALNCIIKQRFSTFFTLCLLYLMRTVHVNSHVSKASMLIWCKSFRNGMLIIFLDQ